VRCLSERQDRQLLDLLARRIVNAADVDDGNLRIIELIGGWLAPDDGAAVDGGEDTDSEQVVFVCAAWMSDDRVHVGRAP
jgi:hypothetical protein